MTDRAFIDALASKQPTPGGGGASAYAGALAAALGSMVANLTVGKKAYAHVEAEMYVCLEKLDDVTNQLIELIEADARAFAPLAACYSMPSDTAEASAAKDRAMQEALIDACEVPLEIMRVIMAVLEQIDFLAEHGSRLAISDAGVAAVFAKAAVQGASLNVFINTSSMTDTDRAQKYENEAESLIGAAEKMADRLFDSVMNTIR
ncbi:MAG: cyclodeaminase/cyclohydrolase family protein [Raoultibacter sp.]|jgi:formiminotetrahydrofolate cyclodeaminase